MSEYDELVRALVRIRTCVLVGLATIACSRPNPAPVGGDSVRFVTSGMPVERRAAFPPRLDLRRIGPNIVEQLQVEQRTACRAGSIVACRFAANLLDSSDRMRAPCALGDIYACRILTTSARRSLEPSDCETGRAPVSFCPIYDADRARAQPLLIDSCRQGVLFDCLAVNNARPASIPMDVPSATIACHFASSCYDIAFHHLERGELADARYHLELLCRGYNACGYLEAAYRGGYIPELYPGRLRELAPSAQPWMAADLEKRVKRAH